MATTFTFEVVTPEKRVVSGDVQTVVAPGSQGEFGVLRGHTTFLTSLKTGVLRYTDAQGEEHELFVSGGFVEVLPDKMTVLAESAEQRREIDLERATAALKRAEERLSQIKTGTVDSARAQAAMSRAICRIKIAKTKKHRHS